MDGCLLHGIVPEHAWPAAVAAGGLHFLAATLEHAEQWPCLHAACSLAHSFPSLCDSLRGLCVVPGISQIDPSWPAGLAPHLTKFLLSDSDHDGSGESAAQRDGGASPGVNWAAFTELCACPDYLSHVVAMRTVPELCSTLRSMQLQGGAVLSDLWSAAQRCAPCMLDAHSCGGFARHLKGAVAACRCALVAANTDESDGAMQYLREQFAPRSQSAPALLFNPRRCLAVSALLLAVHTIPASDGSAGDGSLRGASGSCLPSQHQLLEDSVAQELTEHACSVLQWALECAGEQDSPVDALMHGSILALLSLVLALTGGWYGASQQNDNARERSRSIPPCVTSAAARLCCAKQPVPEALRATALLLLVVVCSLLCLLHGSTHHCRLSMCLK